MRADFISDNLATASKPIWLFRQMIKSMDTDVENDIRTEQIRDIYAIAFAFYDNLYHSYDINELLVITKLAYNKAGIKDSLIYLGSFFGLEFTFSEGFAVSTWKLDITVSCPRMVFKNLSVAITTLHDLANDLIYHAGDLANNRGYNKDGKDPNNKISFDIIILETELQNVNYNYFSLTQTPLQDKYFDYNNSVGHSADFDDRFCVNFRADCIEIEYTGDDDKKFIYKLSYSDGASSASVSADTAGSRDTPVRFSYPSPRCGRTYQLYYKELGSSGGYVPAGKFSKLLPLDDIKISLLNDGGAMHFRLHIDSVLNPAEYQVYYRKQDGETVSEWQQKPSGEDNTLAYGKDYVYYIDQTGVSYSFKAEYISPDNDPSKSYTYYISDFMPA